NLLGGPLDELDEGTAPEQEQSGDLGRCVMLPGCGQHRLHAFLSQVRGGDAGVDEILQPACVARAIGMIGEPQLPETSASTGEKNAAVRFSMASSMVGNFPLTLDCISCATKAPRAFRSMYPTKLTSQLAA